MLRISEQARRTHVVVRSTLASGEDGIVDALLDIALLVGAVEDETGARTTEGLVAVARKEPKSVSWRCEEARWRLTWWW